MSPVKIHYIIDGSNMLYYSGFTEDYGGDVVFARQELTKLLGGIIGEKDNDDSCVSRITVIYDVHRGGWGGGSILKEKEFGVDVIYAAGRKEEQPADKEILGLLEKISKTGSSSSSLASLAEEIVLVTNDNSLRREVIYFGCRPMRCEEFWEKFGLDYR